MRAAYLVAKKDEKIPFYEKLPKQNVFCTHFFQKIKYNQMLERSLVSQNVN